MISLLNTVLKLESLTSSLLRNLFSFFSAAATETTDASIMTADQLSLLQQNFHALQAKFVALMTEKAELVEKLQENEHLIVELSYETETIGKSRY